MSIDTYPLSIHAMAAPTCPENGRLWATVRRVPDPALGWHWFIPDGYNLGTQTAHCTFPTLLCVQRYLAGAWGIPVRDVCV